MAQDHLRRLRDHRAGGVEGTGAIIWIVLNDRARRNSEPCGDRVRGAAVAVRAVVLLDRHRLALLFPATARHRPFSLAGLFCGGEPSASRVLGERLGRRGSERRGPPPPGPPLRVAAELSFRDVEGTRGVTAPCHFERGASTLLYAPMDAEAEESMRQVEQ
ncbi:MAG TPA: hypothetical protein VL242_25255 [Sorangium sp.]|nr:hypothetical protein [Sorangium sp.]